MNVVLILDLFVDVCVLILPVRSLPLCNYGLMPNKIS